MYIRHISEDDGVSDLRIFLFQLFQHGINHIVKLSLMTYIKLRYIVLCNQLLYYCCQLRSDFVRNLTVPEEAASFFLYYPYFTNLPI